MPQAIWKTSISNFAKATISRSLKNLRSKGYIILIGHLGRQTKAEFTMPYIMMSLKDGKKAPKTLEEKKEFEDGLKKAWRETDGGDMTIELTEEDERQWGKKLRYTKAVLLTKKGEAKAEELLRLTS